MWAFAGRDAERAAVRAALREGPGLLLLGEPGTGRTRLAAEARALTVTAHDPGIPFGMFAHLLEGSCDPHNPTGWAASVLATAGAVGPGRALVADDVHLADPLSAALLAQLVLHRGVRLLATARSGAPLPQALAGLLPALELAPLTAADTGRMLVSALGGPVEPLTVRRLWHASRGNARFLAEIVRSAQITHAAGLWRWTPEHSLPEPLLTWAESCLGDLSEPERDALELIALAEPLELSALLSKAAPETLERLERRRLIRVAQSRVRMRNPLHTQVVRARSGQIRTRRLLADLGLAHDDPALDDPEHSQLSSREFEIARLASCGLTNREIADCLSLSPRTVGNHLCNVYTKLGVNDRTKLTPTLLAVS